MIRRGLVIILLFILSMLLERTHPVELCCVPVNHIPPLRSDQVEAAQRELLGRAEGRKRAFLGMSTLELLAAGRKYGRALYGEDDRDDLDSASPPADAQVEANMDATVLIVDESIVSQGYDKRWTIDANPLYSYDVCGCERFSSQPSAAAGFPCSGFLITNRLVLTASHCVPRRTALALRRFVFGFHRRKDGTIPPDYNEHDVQIAEDIVYRSDPCDAGNADLALVLLKEDIHHKTVELSSIPPKKGDKVYEIGYPIGLPAKYAPNAKVRHAPTTSAYFVTNMDGYDGNSGSPVFDASSHRVLGVHVRGEISLARPCGCWTSTWCPNNGCSGEEVTRIDRLPLLNQLPQCVPDTNICSQAPKPPHPQSPFFVWASRKRR